MVEGLIIFAVILYVAFHLGAGHAHNRHDRAHGRRGVPVCWNSAMRGPWGSISAPSGFRVRQKLCAVRRPAGLGLPSGRLGALWVQRWYAYLLGRSFGAAPRRGLAELTPEAVSAMRIVTLPCPFAVLADCSVAHRPTWYWPGVRLPTTPDTVWAKNESAGVVNSGKTKPTGVRADPPTGS